MSEKKPKIYEFNGKFYARTANGGCINCVFGSNHNAICARELAPKFVYKLNCSRLSGPAFEEVEKPASIKTPKKLSTTHSKPTTKGVKLEKKPAAAKVPTKVKYPAPREMLATPTTEKPLDKMTKAELIGACILAGIRFTNLAGVECDTGTKLDRALVDLKEAKRRIKELTKNDGAPK